MRKILTVPDPRLSSPTKTIERFDGSLKKIIKEMIETLKAQTNPPGVGLAANQVGFDLSLFIIKPQKKSKIKIFVNPRIVEAQFSKKKASYPKKKLTLEGCLSIPGIWATVDRAWRVLLEYQDESGIRKKKWFTGFEAKIIQHEIDHLKGILFTQRALEQNQKIYQQKNDHLEEINL
ncbi:MAG: peptide deformylase [Patescibacteria group bacterium]|nr:peptide deformylase [Patescibacteria group bacterium]